MYGIRLYSHTRVVTIACITMAMSEVTKEIRGSWQFGHEDVIIVIDPQAPAWKVMERLEEAIAASGEVGISLVPVDPEPVQAPAPIDWDDDDEDDE